MIEMIRKIMLKNKITKGLLFEEVMSFSLDKEVGSSIYHFHVVRTALIKSRLRKVLSKSSIIRVEVPLLSALAFYLDDRNISPDMLLNSKISGDYIILDSVIFQNKNISWKKTISVVILPEEKIKPIKGYGIKNLVNIIVKK